MKNQESVTKKLRKNKKWVIFCSVLLVFAGAIIFANIFSGVLIPSSTQVSQNITSPAFKLQFISLKKSQISSSAKSLAGDMQKLGAGGYLWQRDGYFHVIASCYERENDATLVQSNIKSNHGLDSEIFTVEFPQITLSGEYDGQSKKVLSKALRSFYTAFTQLFDIAVSLDTSVYNSISARLAVNNVHSEFSSGYADFKTLFSTNQAQVIKKLDTKLSQATSVLEKLCSGKLVSTGQTYSSLIKYRYTQVLDIYYSFANV